MSEPDKEGDSGPANRPNPPPPEKFQFRVIAVWVSIIGLLGILYFNSGKIATPAPVQPLTLQKVLEYVEKEQIKPGTAIMTGDSTIGILEISFQLKDQVEVPATDGNAAAKLSKSPTLSLETVVSPSQYETLTKANFKWVRATTVAKELVSSLLVFTIVIGLLYFLFVRQIKNAGRTAMSFGKSRAKMLAKDGSKITFKDVAGCDEAKEEVSEVVDFLKDPKKYQKMGARIPKGVLLVGPPGTGKTLLARAVAGEADVPFFSISGSDFVEMFVGVGAARVRDMFEQGRKNAPCIIFIDEIDAVGRKRGHGHGGGNDEREQTLNSILVEMDGFDAQEGIIIIAATNRADVLDAALLRPGRFDRQVNVDLPDLNGRVEILKVHAKKIKLSAEVDLKQAARGTSGFSGADLANLLNEAALLAARHNKTEVNLRNISDARDKISFGLERRKLMDEEDKKITAWHEAGHALVQATLDKGKHPVYQVTILPRGRALGMMMFFPTKDIVHRNKEMCEADICCAMAGRVAEDITFDEVSSGASGDIRQATHIARLMVCEWGMSPLGMVNYSKDQSNPEYGDFGMTKNYSDETARRIDELVREIIDRQYARAKDICLANRAKLDTIAQALLTHETILGLQVMEIMEFGEIRTPVEQATSKPQKDTPPPLKKPSSETNPENGLGPAPTPVPA